MNRALRELGFAAHPVEAYKYFVGDGVREEAMRALPAGCVDDQTVGKCVELARQAYSRCWADNTRAYPGIAELLNVLEKKATVKAILSNKPDNFTQLNVSKLLGQWSFDIVRGVSENVRPKPDPRGALEIADELGVEPSEFVYLGDTNTDMKTAVAAGMYPVGALWGFRTADELLESGAKKLLEKPQELLDII